MTGAEALRVHFVVPRGVDDPERVSGGNVFDRRVRDGLSRIGWDVRVSQIDPDASSAAASILADVPDEGLVLIDGLVAIGSPAALEAEAARLRIVMLAHMVSHAFADADPEAVEGERRALRAAARVIVTSEWTRTQLIERKLVPSERIVVATPGSDDAPRAIGTRTGGSVLCVGVVAPHKGQDTLVEALGALGAADPWRCTIAGSLTASPEFAQRVAGLAGETGVGDRITMTGVLTEGELDDAYRHADLVVAPSRTESYGMAIADALRRGIPVVASRIGGIPQTVAPGRAAILVPPDEPRAWSDVLGRWIADADLRARLTGEARRGRSGIPHWSTTADRVAETLRGMR